MSTPELATSHDADTAHPAPPSEQPRRARSNSPADRFMRRLLRVPAVAPSKRTSAEAQGAFRASLIVSGIRCIITYLLIPILVPIISFAEWFAAPVGIVLCVVAVFTGINSVRRFWISDHRFRWMYTGFITFVFVVLAIALTADISRLLGAQ